MMKTKTNKFLLRLPRILPLIALFLMVVLSANAGTRYVWVGGASGQVNDWNVNANWSPGTGYPGSSGSTTDAAFIPSATNNPNLNTTVTIDSILIQNNGTLTFTPGNALTINDNAVIGPNSAATSALLDFSSGTNGTDLIIGGTLSGFGALVLYGTGQTIEIGGNMTIAIFSSNDGTHFFGSTVLFNGGLAQSINPGTAGTYTFDNLEIANSHGVTNNASVNIQIYGDLSGSGTLNGGTNSQINLVGNLTMTPGTFNAQTSTVVLFGAYNDLNSTGRTDIQSVNTQTFYNLTVQDGYAYLSGNITVSNFVDFEGLTASGIDGASERPASNIKLNGFNITISNGGGITEGASPVDSTYNGNNGFIVTNYTTGGSLIMNAQSSGTCYPLGRTATVYNPIVLYPPSTVNVKATIYQDTVGSNTIASTSTGGQITSYVVLVTWLLTQTSGSPIAMSVQPFWNASQDGTSFDPSHVYVAWRTADPSQWHPMGPTTGQSESTTGPTTVPDNILSNASINSGTMASGTTYYIATGNNVSQLPVSLITFGAQYQDTHVNLNWTTASEENNAYFEVERSTDANTWTSIGQVQGHGTSNVLNSYVDIDNLAGVIPTGTIYYRLKQVDFNGAFEYSMIRSVDLTNQDPSLAIYPNPTSNTLNINWTSATEDNTVLRLVNMSGANVYTQTVSGKGMIQRQIDMTLLPSGVYYLQVISSNGNTVNEEVFKN